MGSMGSRWNRNEQCLHAWQRPDQDVHVNELELARIETVLQLGRVSVRGEIGQPNQCCSEGFIEHLVSHVLWVADVHPAKRYAYLRTGFLATVENTGQLGQQQLLDWRQAVAEYSRLHSGSA